MEVNGKVNEYDDKFEELNDKINSLMDIILKVKVDFELMTRKGFKIDMHSQLIKTTKEDMNHFFDNRPSKCKGIVPCTTNVDKSVMEILRLFSEQDYLGAITFTDKVINYIDTYNVEHDVCPDSSCLERSRNIYITVKNLLNTVEQQKVETFKELFIRDSEFQLSEGNEKKESTLMSALSNETRIKILKQLSKGSMLYTQLERKLGLKGGRFHFHLKNLINANYITSEKEHGTYSITVNGLKAIKIIHELSKSANINQVKK